MARDDFPLHFGAPALDFAATLAWRGDASRERVADAAQFGRWLHAAGLVDRGTVPTGAEYRDALELREAIARAGKAVVGRKPPQRHDIELINAAARAPRAIVQLDPETFTRLQVARSPVRAALATLAENAIEVFTQNRRQLTTCNDERCAQLMLSRSRGAKRRWCSMQSCGNRNKVAAFRARTTSP